MPDDVTLPPLPSDSETPASSQWEWSNADMHAYARAAVRADREGRQQPWKDLFWKVAIALNCLPSTFASANDHVLAAAHAKPESRRDTLLSVLGKLNSNPYNLTKMECTSVIEEMYRAADAQRAEGNDMKTIEDAREAARAAHKHASPYRVGIYAALLGVTAPNPYPQGTRGWNNYEDGLAAGERRKSEEAARQQQEGASNG